MLRLYKAPDKLHVEINYASSSENRTVVGSMAWYQHEPAKPTVRGATTLQAARMALPWNVLAKPSAAIDLGPIANADGKTVRAVEFPLEEQLKLVVEIDPETGYILRSRGILTMAQNSVEFATVYSDFRKGNGRIRAAHEDQFAMGRYLGHSRIDKIEYPESMQDSVFLP